MKHLKSITTYDMSLGRRRAVKNVVRVGERWMHGSIGVVTITDLTGSKMWDRRVYFKDINGKEYAISATYTGNGWQVIARFAFNIDAYEKKMKKF